MSFLRKFKKLVKVGLKLAIKTAPIWSSFIPGGSIAGKILSKTGIGGQGGGFLGGSARFPFARVTGAIRGGQGVDFRGVNGRLLKRRGKRTRAYHTGYMRSYGAQMQRRRFQYRRIRRVA